MPRISATVGPSNNDLAKETTTLKQQGKLDPVSSKPIEWAVWKLT